jgi:hypothetical protein
MGTTFVSIDRNHGFWMRDSVLELWLRLLALHVEDPSEPAPLTRQIRDTWLLASRGYFNGHVPHSLEDFASTETGRRTIEHALRSLMDALSHAPAIIDRSALVLLGLDHSAAKSIETRRLIEIGHAFRDLLDGNIPSTAAETSFMPGSR